MNIEKKIMQIKWGALLYLLLIIPIGCEIPEWIAWENGPLEMLQNIVLVICIGICLYFWRQSMGKTVHTVWLASAGYFFLLLGRELSWRRVFFQTHMTAHGPVFISMHSIPHYEVMYGFIGVYMLVVFAAIIMYMPWRRIFFALPLPKLLLTILILASLLAIMGDKGQLFHTYVDENIEELAELLAYIVQGALVIWYHCQLKHVDKEGISM